MWIILQLTVIALTILPNVSSEKVLVLCPVSSKSHKNIIEAIIGGLAQRNHSITVVSSYKTPIPGVRDIVIQDGFDYFKNLNTIEARKLGIYGIANLNFYRTIYETCERTYQNQEFMKLLDETFDLVIMDAFGNHCLQGFVYKLKSPPVIWSMPTAPADSFTRIFGTHSPPSFVTDSVFPFTINPNIWQKLVNVVVSHCFWTYYFSQYSEYQEISRKYLGQDIPDIRSLEANMSMMLMNTHYAINNPRPLMPDIVEIGGVHCRPGKPLPNDLEEFFAGAKNGVILFSLGSLFRGEHMPEETRRVFVDAFSKLKQRVIWRWDYEEMTDLPANVITRKWLPVQDILAHPNTKLFITHGGLLSTQEAIYHGVPMVGIPLFGDQDANINNYVEAGIALNLEILGIKSEDITFGIQQVMSNASYHQRIKKLSQLFRDQPQPALERAIFWSEYVMRHKGAPELRSLARKLTLIHYHSLDVVTILIAIASAILAVIGFCIKAIFRKCCWKSSDVSEKKLK